MSSVLAPPSTINKDSFAICDTNVQYCRSLIEVNFFTDQVRPALGSVGWLVGQSFVTMLCAQGEYKILKFASGHMFSCAKLNFNGL